ncbi:MAG: uroporphyrinogen decarboxylase family protein [Candidatus Hydrogenedentota bacterium]
MTPKERFIAALERRTPDRLPVTTHHVMPYFLDNYMGGMGEQTFFDHFGLDPITWPVHFGPDTARGERHSETVPEWVESDQWWYEQETAEGRHGSATRTAIHTPKGTLTTVSEENPHTTWQLEYPIKEKRDIEILAEFAPWPVCDVPAAQRDAAAFGGRGLVRGTFPMFPTGGQPGCWQDAACLYGIEKLIMAAFEDPQWVHEFLAILRDRKLNYVASMHGAPYDLLELGGGDASTTVISPQIFNDFVAPYDAPIIAAAHEAGQRVVYHTCGGMMPILEDLAAMGPDALETFTPVGMGGDVDLAEAKRRIGGKVGLIGGFDQFHFFKDCTPEETRAEVRRCFEAAGDGGGYILSPSDHFFDADPALIAAYAGEARKCWYNGAHV